MLEKLTKILIYYTGNNELVLSEEQQLIADIGLNSLDLMNLVCEIEDEFDVEIPDRMLRNFKTVGDVMDYIKKQ